MTPFYRSLAYIHKHTSADTKTILIDNCSANSHYIYYYNY